MNKTPVERAQEKGFASAEDLLNAFATSVQTRLTTLNSQLLSVQAQLEERGIVQSDITHAVVEISQEKKLGKQMPDLPIDRARDDGIERIAAFTHLIRELTSIKNDVGRHKFASALSRCLIALNFWETSIHERSNKPKLIDPSLSVSLSQDLKSLALVLGEYANAFEEPSACACDLLTIQLVRMQAEIEEFQHMDEEKARKKVEKLTGGSLQGNEYTPKNYSLWAEDTLKYLEGECERLQGALKELETPGTSIELVLGALYNQEASLLSSLPEEIVTLTNSKELLPASFAIRMSLLEVTKHTTDTLRPKNLN